jgi:hypothetical protein
LALYGTEFGPSLHSFLRKIQRLGEGKYQLAMVTKPGKQEKNQNCQTGEEKNGLGNVYRSRDYEVFGNGRDAGF